jgi:VanZ family protein
MRSVDRWVAGALLAHALFFVYGSWVPLDWQPVLWADAWRGFMALPTPRWPASERVDAAVNFLLPLPLAFGLAHLAAGLRPSALRWAVWLLVWPLLAALSVAVEFAQMFLPARNPSWSDVAAQWAGAAAGLVVFAAWGGRFAALLQGLSRQQPAHSRVTQWLGVWLALLVLFSMMPLDLSISPVELYRKWRDGRVVLVPFGAPWRGAPEFVYELASDVLLWVPVGLLWQVDGQQRSFAAVLLRGVLAAALVEALQLIVMSRVSDVTDVLLAGVGVALGAALPMGLGSWSVRPVAAQRRGLALALAVWGLVAAGVLWFPFNFDTRVLTAADAWQAFTRPPFETYFLRGEFSALSEILRKLLVFLPGGLLLGAWAARCHPRPHAAPALAALTALALVLEAGQLLVPGKVADLTDALLGAGGAALGWFITTGRRPVQGAAPHRITPTPLVRPQRLAPPWPWTSLAAVVSVMSVAALLWAASRLPGVPYNVVKLMPAGPAGGAAALGVALVLWWMFAAPLWLLWPQRQALRLAFVPLGLVHALLTFAVLRASVPLPMIHKVIGDPVLGGIGLWEDLARYSALHLSLMLPLFGALLLVRAVARPAALADFVGWCFWVLLLAGPLHWAVVVQAGTDNLVELMRGGGNVMSSAALATAVFLATTAGSAAAAGWAQPGRRRSLWVLAALALVLAPLALWAGLEPLLLKYERAFSAWQFLLSAGRDRYASGSALAGRFVLAYGSWLTLMAALQAPQWQALSRLQEPAMRPRPGAAGGLPAA